MATRPIDHKALIADLTTVADTVKKAGPLSDWRAIADAITVIERLRKKTK